MVTARQVGRSASLYPITGLYLAAVGAAVLIQTNTTSLSTGLLALAFGAAVALVVATWVELRVVHELVNGQHTALLGRIDELTRLLTQAGVSVSAPSPKEVEAREDQAKESAGE